MRGNSRYLVPIDVADGSSPTEAPHGTYTLTSGHTYVYILPTKDTAFTSIDLQGLDAALAFTSATVQDTNHPGSVNGGPTAGDLPDTDTAVGGWKNERPTNGYVAVDGTGWSVGTAATACVVASTGAGVGGALWHIAETGAARTRLIVVCTGTGKARVSGAGKGV
jgi:hypothetical protein